MGDIGGKAELLNDASINYVAFDGKVGVTIINRGLAPW